MSGVPPVTAPGALPDEHPVFRSPGFRGWIGLACLLLAVAGGAAYVASGSDPLGPAGAPPPPPDLSANPPPENPAPPPAPPVTGEPAPRPPPPMQTSIPETYRARVAALLRELRIPESHVARHGLALIAEATVLESVGPDTQGRPALLAPEAARAWRSLRDAAARDGVALQIVSAFRSVDYQRDIFRRKRAQGQRLETILAVNVPPGYSEHHTGRALDFTVAGIEPLQESFERTPAFAWLARHAARYGFTLSFPRGNLRGVAYEPWHWYYDPDRALAAAPARTNGVVSAREPQP